MKTSTTITGALLLPMLALASLTFTSCKDDPSDGCLKCETKFGSVTGSCSDCSTRIDSIDDLMMATECCGCPSFDKDWSSTPNLIETLAWCDDEASHTNQFTPEFACQYGVETLTCGPWEDTSGGGTVNPYGDESPLTDGWTGGMETTTGYDPTDGEDPGSCPEHSVYNCSGWAIGVYHKSGVSQDTWQPPSGPKQICFGWWGDNDPNYNNKDVTHGLEVCATTEAEARDKCEDECPAYLAGYFPAAGGNSYNLSSIYCDFHGIDTSVPTPEYYAVPSSVDCYSSEIIENGELHEINVMVIPGEPCAEGDCPPGSECTNWNNTSHIDSPAYNIGRTADTTCTGSPCAYNDHKVKIDDDFLAKTVKKPGPITRCDGPWFDFATNELNGSFNTGDMLKELGLSGLAYDLKVGPTSTGPWYDCATAWFDGLQMYEDGDVDFYMTWKSVIVTSPYYTTHKQRVQVVECGVNACPNP